jgi:hypothetical protein
VAFAAAISYSSWTNGIYNDFQLNSSGLASIPSYGVSKFGSRNASYDAAAISPTWGNFLNSVINIYYADQAGTSNDPKLVVSYTPASKFSPPNKLRPRLFRPGLAR